MYTSQSYLEPFWAENNGFITGRDALGIQNSSISTYSRLLPGMTNLTLRLRYYGFYMWVLQNYQELYGSNTEKTYKDQYFYVRKAELIMAFIMMQLHPDEQSVIGSDYTKRNAKEVDELGYYNITKGADKSNGNENRELYWDFGSGALGQYYAGSLVSLKLIKSEGFFIIEEQGQQLALAFANNIEDNQKQLFLTIIETGKLDMQDLEQLADFALNNIPVHSDEWNFYIQMLMGTDGVNLVDDLGAETNLRRESLSLYLKYLFQDDDAYDNRSFIKWQYNEFNPEESGNASFGWTYYYVNEAIHFALETIFWSILVDLRDKERVFNDYIELITERIVSNSKELYINISLDSTLNDYIVASSGSSVVSLLEALEEKVKNYSNNEEAEALAFQLLLAIYNSNYSRIDKIKAFEHKYGINNQRGRISENFSIFIETKLNCDFKTFIKDALKILLNNHINSAYRKMGNGEGNLLKFMIEDGIIFHIQTMEPSHTSPRLKALENFMRDLSLITKERKLTDEGTSILTRL